MVLLVFYWRLQRQHNLRHVLTGKQLTTAKRLRPRIIQVNGFFPSQPRPLTPNDSPGYVLALLDDHKAAAHNLETTKAAGGFPPWSSSFVHVNIRTGLYLADRSQLIVKLRNDDRPRVANGTTRKRTMFCAICCCGRCAGSGTVQRQLTTGVNCRVYSEGQLPTGPADDRQ
jgi:hypothetical protein